MAKPPPTVPVSDPYGQKSALREVTGDWPGFVEERAVPAIGFWLVFVGGVAVGFIGACVLAWSVLA